MPVPFMSVFGSRDSRNFYHPYSRRPLIDRVRSASRFLVVSGIYGTSAFIAVAIILGAVRLVTG